MFTGHWGCKELQANLQEEREAAQRSIRKKLQGFAFQWPLVHLWAAPLKSPVSDTQHSWKEQMNFPVKQFFKDFEAMLKTIENTEDITKKRSLGLHLFRMDVTIVKQVVNTPDIFIRGV